MSPESGAIMENLIAAGELHPDVRAESARHTDAATGGVVAAPVPAPAPLRGSGEQGTSAPLDLSIPQVGEWHDDDHRYFMNGDGPIPSVTSVLDVIERPNLTRYFKARIAQLTINLHRDGRLAAMLGEKTDAQVVSAILDMPDEKKNRAANVGTGVHLFADRVARSDGSYGFEIPAEYQPFIDAFSRFLGRFSASHIVSSEHAILGAGYAGTFDLLIMLPACVVTDDVHVIACDCALELWLLDVKTGERLHDDMALQLAGYANAECIVLPGDPKRYTFPKPKRCGILHLRPDRYRDVGYRVVEYPITHDDYVAFLAALELYTWRREGRYEPKNLRSFT